MRETLLSCIHDGANPRSIATYFRRKRGLFLKEYLRNLPRPVRLLDVGGTEDFWIYSNLLPCPGVNITLLNVTEPKVSRDGFSSVVGDGCNLNFPDKSFDVVFSNSVIEHLGSPENQQRMAAEVQRVGRGYFVQTPARYFPIEPHFMFPFFWHLPEPMREYLAARIKLGWYPPQETKEAAHEFLKKFLLVTESQFHGLFPNSELIHERVVGLTKSYIAYRKPSP